MLVCVCCIQRHNGLIPIEFLHDPWYLHPAAQNTQYYVEATQPARPQPQEQAPQLAQPAANLLVESTHIYGQ